MEKNLAIKSEARKKGVHLWEIAERIGITDSTFSKRLRRELSDSEQENVLEIIEQIFNERSGI